MDTRGSEPTPSGLILPPGIREAGQEAIRRNRKQRRGLKKKGIFDNRTATGIIVPDPEPSTLHYHIIYHVPKDEVIIPHYDRVFLNASECWDAIHEIGNKAEPNCEWYEEGPVGIETTMHGRTGLHWIIMQASGCDRSTCRPKISRENLKRAMIVMPGERRKT